MKFRILGPLEVANGHGPISFDAPKQRALLGVLLLHPNEVVSSERLIDELWGERPPATAIKVVQTYISQLRKAIGSDVIVTRPPGYVLRIEEGALDAERFRRLTSEGQALAAKGEQTRADEHYREALALWRGPPLADVVFESFARNEVARLEEERLGALMERIDCELALGRHDELVAELETLVREHPLRERLHRQLMLALYRSGRQADALAAYQDARRTLVEELGLEPSAELQALERAILTHDAALEPPPRVAPEHPARQRFLSRRALAAAALVLLAVASGLAVALDGDESTPTLLAPNSVGFIDAESGRVTRSFPVGREPRALTVAKDAVWVANYQNKTVTRIDLGSGRPDSIPVGGHPSGITSYRGKVWVWTLEGLLVPIDPRFNTAGARIRPPGGRRRFVRGQGPALGRIVAGGGFLWMTAPGTTVVRLDPADPGSALPIVPDAGADGPIAYGEDGVWVGGSDVVFPITATIGYALAGSTVGGPVRDLAFDGDSLWVVSGGAGGAHARVVPALRRVDPHTGLLETTIRVGDRPVAVTAAAGSIWVAGLEGREGAIYRVDPARGRVVQTIAVGGATPTAMAADADGVWVAVA